MIMKIYNTLSGRKEELEPLDPPKVGIYACGVTVYDYCHIGHARSAIVFDVIRRYLKYKGFDVTYVRNFTDIDDKIINKAKEEGIAWDTVAQKYTDEYYRDIEMLGVEGADVEPKATDHIPEIIKIIGALIEKDYAYEISGNVYFSVEKFPGYGKLSKRDRNEMLAGARVEVDERKKNPLDFTLWKNSKEGEPSWESPWGSGRPGWHIECTAMSMKYLGESFDIHGGGADLLFPHHENEIAQSEAFTGKPFVKYWVHNGFITVDKEKMSKSLGNFFTIREVLDKFDAEVLRFFLLSTHYRSPIEFSDEQLREAEKSLDRCYSTIARIGEYLKIKGEGRAELSGVGRTFENQPSDFKKFFEEAMDDDFNTALAIGHVFELLRETNRLMDRKPEGTDAREFLVKSKEVLSEVSRVLNLLNRTPHEWQLSLLKTKKLGLDEKTVTEKIRERWEQREKENWKRADAIRRELEERGIILEDKKDRTDWKVRIG
ncbi:MAG: cysteine--tRNA ligase [Nitrospirota bacterium]